MKLGSKALRTELNTKYLNRGASCLIKCEIFNQVHRAIVVPPFLVGPAAASGSTIRFQSMQRSCLWGFTWSDPFFHSSHHSTALPRFSHALSLLFSPSLPLSFCLAGRSRACWLSIKKLSLRVAQALSATICCQLVTAKEKEAREKKAKAKWKNGKNVFPLSYFRVRIK